MSKVYVVGGFITPFEGKGFPGWEAGAKDLKNYMSEAVQGALKETGVKAEAIDRIYVGNSLVSFSTHKVTLDLQLRALKVLY